MSPNEPQAPTSSLAGSNLRNEAAKPDSVTSAPIAGLEGNPGTEASEVKKEAASDTEALGDQNPNSEDLIALVDETAAASLEDVPADGVEPGHEEPVATDEQDGGRSSSQTTEPMDSSVATLKPTPIVPPDTSTQYLTVESKAYVDPTPPTPTTSDPPSRTPSSSRSRYEASPTRSDAADNESRDNPQGEEEEGAPGSQSEIQSIMEQFTGDGGGPGAEEVMSPRLEMTTPFFSGPIQHPPRRSSLEPLSATFSHQHIQEVQGRKVSPSSPVSLRSPNYASEDFGPPVPPKDAPSETSTLRSQEQSQGSTEGLTSPSSATVHLPPPPEPEPEPALPFDFHRFLEQLRNKKADPVARYLKSFLSEFGKRQWMVHEQVKIISDFLAFIANKMAQCEVWRDVSDAEFDNAREGMEKLVMNRLYSQTFSPAIPAPQPIPGAKPKKRGGERPMGPGRRGQHQEDVERDEILTQRINIYGWIREEHLDIPASGDSGARFLKLAQQELLKIKSYRAPRDKIICVLNCCKVIFGLLKHNKSDSSADSFMPFLIYVVLQSNPEHLVSNVQYILRFRNQEKLGGEAGYYLSSLLGAIQFVENMDRTSLTITDDEFEKNVEAAVSAIAEKHRAESPPPDQQQQPQLSEKVHTSLLLPLAGQSSSNRPSLEIQPGEASTPRRSTSSEGDSDGQVVTGLLRTIQKPLNTIGRIFSDEGTEQLIAGRGRGGAPGGTSEPAESGRASPGPDGADEALSPGLRHQLSVEEAAARQASAEAAEAQRLQRAEHHNVVETLSAMFPDLDRDVISDVVHQKQGRVGLAVDACLAFST